MTNKTTKIDKKKVKQVLTVEFCENLKQELHLPFSLRCDEKNPELFGFVKKDLKKEYRKGLKTKDLTIKYIVDLDNHIDYYHRFERKYIGRVYHLYKLFFKLVISDHELPSIFEQQYKTSDFNEVIDYIEDNYDFDYDDVLFTPSLKTEAIYYHNLYPYVNNPKKWEEVEKRFFIEEGGADEK